MDFLKLVRAQWDRAAAIAAIAAGVVALILGYVGISGTGFSAEQMPYIVSGGITGLFCLGLGATLHLSADLRDEWRKLDDLEHRLAAMGVADTPPAPDATGYEPEVRAAGRTA